MLLFVAVFAVALALRLGGSHRVGPYDDAYHLKRIESFPHLIQFDADRDAWCPWPPLYDFVCGAIGTKHVVWLPPIGFAIFAAALAWRFGSVAGFGVALAPYLIGASSVGDIDHHWVEPMLVAFILVALLRRSAGMLAVAITCALFVQTALIVACGLAFIALWLTRCPVAGARCPGNLATGHRAPATGHPLIFDPQRRYTFAFLVPALAVAIWRLAVPYPENAWFLGWSHVALLVAAAVALALRGRWYALPIAVALMLPFLPELIEGTRFFHGDPWLASIVEFQPMFRDASRVGTDVANLGGGVLALCLILWIGARARGGEDDSAPQGTKIVLLFAIVYTLLAISSRRFLVPGIVTFAIAGSIAVAASRASLGRRPPAGSPRHAAFTSRGLRAAGRRLRGCECELVQAIAIALTLLPPLAYDAYALAHPDPSSDSTPFVIAAEIRPLPPGRVLAPWYLGHAIDVFGRHAVVIDNFGSMPDETRFELANDALAQRHPEQLLAYCRRNHVEYVVTLRPRSMPGFMQVAPHVWRAGGAA